jgi:superfamily II DNA or RNA helicase
MGSDNLDELERLRRELKEITAERDRLLVENRFLIQASKNGQSLSRTELRNSLESGILNLNTCQPTGRSSVNSDAPLFERINLFRSLFHGREDIYAKFWQNKQTFKIGYTPVCLHEWDPGLCQKPATKCNDCLNRELAPLTNKVIENHFDGKITVGIYPLLKDDKCAFLAIDFDKGSWFEDSAAFIETCRLIGVPAVLERSRSGNGGHIWIFFSEVVPAAKARNLGCYLLTQTMSRRYQLGMDSYDRLFPNQDTVPKGGFGNLIALPLQKGPGEKGNSLFVDDNFKPYSDQWSFLATIKRLNSSALDEVISEAVRTGQIIGVRFTSTEDEEKPWALNPSKRERAMLSSKPLPEKIEIVLSNLVYLEKSQLSSPLLNKIKRLAAFQNPEFYRKQKMRLSTALTPRVINCSDDFPKYVSIPRGCLDELIELLKIVGIKGEISEKYFQGTEIKAKFRGHLTSVQETAVGKLLKSDNGILVAPAGSGKTVIGISIIASRKVNTLVLVHRRPLLEQWLTQLASFLEIDPSKIGHIGGGKDKRTGLIDVAMLQSLMRNERVNDLIAEYGQVIVDECHHLPAFTFEQVLRQAKARYVVGLTATPYRRDGQQPIILMQCGPIRYEISAKDQKSLSLIPHRLIRRNTDFTLPPSEGELNIHGIYAALTADEERNKLIIEDILKSLDEGRSPILLTERREHLDFFATQLAKLIKHVIVLHGGMGSKQRREVSAHLANIPEGEKRIILATGRYIGEGFDDNRLDTLFLALPVSWKGTLVQYAGRLHRMHAGKTEVCIYDYVDNNVPVLLRMFQKRLRGYNSMGYHSDTDNAPRKVEGLSPTLWDNSTFDFTFGPDAHKLAK